MPAKGVECIYCFYNPATGKSYIGLTTNEPQRHHAHYRRFLQGARTSKFYNSLRKHGWDAFEYRILAVKPAGASDQWLPNAERIAIAMYDSYHNGYNMTPGGEVSSMLNPEVVKKSADARRGRKVPEEVREKIRRSNTGKEVSEEARKKMSLAGRGRKQAPEHVEKRISKIRGENNGMRRVGFTQEHRQKITLGLQGENNGMHGRRHSDEARAKMRARKVGRPLSDEHRAKLSMAQTERNARLRAERMLGA